MRGRSEGSVINNAVEKGINEEGSYAVFEPEERFYMVPKGGELIFKSGSNRRV
jgi:hypothetical protein